MAKHKNQNQKSAFDSKLDELESRGIEVARVDDATITVERIVDDATITVSDIVETVDMSGRDVDNKGREYFKPAEGESVRCCRCHSRAVRGDGYVRAFGTVVGVECLETMDDLREKLGNEVSDADLVRQARAEYVEMMRQTTVTGMILKGFLSLSEMVGKGKITVDQFRSVAKDRRRERLANEIISASGL